MSSDGAPPIQAQITGYWDWRGSDYDAQPRHGLHDEREKAVWLDWLRATLPRPPADVLDVGTGTGFLALLAAEAGHRATGVDLAEGMLAVARSKAAALTPAPAFVIGDAHDPGLPPGAFDVVMNRHVLWTLTDPARALHNWFALLRPGGRLVAIDGLWGLDRPAEDRHELPSTVQQMYQRHYNPDVVQALPLRQATGIEPLLAMVAAAGFVEPRVERLDAVEAVERELHPPGDAPGQPRYVLVARRPAGG